MGIRVHACSKYEVEYGCSRFNNNTSKFFQLLRDNSIPYIMNGEFEETTTHIEIEQEDFNKALERMTEDSPYYEELKSYFESASPDKWGTLHFEIF